MRNKFIELNKRLAFIRQLDQVNSFNKCDDLTEQEKKRLEELLEGIDTFYENFNEECKKINSYENPYNLTTNTNY